MEDPETAKRRLAFQRSYSLEHGGAWRRRSLIEDAKFDTVTNAEFARKERESITKERSFSDEDVFTLATSDQTITNGSALSESQEVLQKCSVVFSLRDIASLSRVFKTFENCRASVLHVESRKSKRKGAQMEFYVRFESSTENVLNVVKSLKQSSAIVDLNVLPERDPPQEVPWFPRHVSDLDKCQHLLTKFDPDLDYDHPGFADKEYRTRRSEIASIAFDYRWGHPIPRVEYTEDETKTWGTVYRMLKDLHSTHCCREYVENFRLFEKECGYSEHSIPQLEDINQFLKRRSGFQLRPVAGLLSARDFLSSLAFRIFQCTQYIRHGSKPDHTVEPDCVHELLGHVPMFADPSFAEFSQEIGLASLGTSDADIEKFATLYWFTVEFGLCKQDGGIRAYGAGLLSAFGELKHALSDVPKKKPFDPMTTAVQPYQDQDYQPLYFVAESFEDAKEKMRQYAATIKRPFEVRYDPYTQTVQLLDNKNTIQQVTYSLRGELVHLHSAIQRIENISFA